MTKIYHNPRCSKSRQTLELLKDRNETLDIVLYLDNPLTKMELSALIKKLGITPIELVRKNEIIWKEQFKNKKMTDSQIVDAMAKYPKLIERPIVVKGGKAALGRPPESVLNIL